MRIGISALAWSPVDDAAVAKRLATLGIDTIDVAPGKYFPDPFAADDGVVDRVRQWWHDRGLAIGGMQGLLHGSSGLNVFGPPPVQDAMLRWLEAIARIGARLGARHLVFGSPRNRDRSGLDDATAHAAGVAFFRRMGAVGEREGVVFCLEPNPPVYGANFMTTTAEAATVVAAVDHPAIRLQLDSGALALAGEDPLDTVARFAPLVAHIHASEPGLGVVGDGAVDHARVAQAVRRYLPDRQVVIEMMPRDLPVLVSVERAVKAVQLHYGEGPVLEAAGRVSP